MRVKFVETKTSWREVADAARTTIGLEAGEGQPAGAWKRRLLLAEHSPVRQLLLRWKWEDLKYWVSVHYVRHKIGIEHFVSTQRSDRTHQDRDTLPQSALVSHECLADAQAVLNISRKRLCRQASPETREAWEALLAGLREQEPELCSVCVPECVYRGFCPELKPCGYSQTAAFQEALARYRGTGAISTPARIEP